MLALLAGSALAAGPEVWAAMYDGRLAASLDRDPQAATAVYEAVLDHLDEGDPHKSELSYWLALARYDAGDHDGARKAVEGVGSDVNLRRLTREFRARLDLIDHAVGHLPFGETHDEGTGAWVRDWTASDSRALEIVDGSGPGGKALLWQTEVQDDRSDTLMLGLAPDAAGVRTIRLFARSERFASHVRLVAEDTDGERWVSGPIELPLDEWAPVDVAMASLSGPGEGGPRSVSLLRLEEIAAQLDPARGTHRILIDDLELR